MRTKYPHLPLEGEKIVTAEEMEKWEQIATVEHDATAEQYMQQAAFGIFTLAKEYIAKHYLQPHVILLCARGNNSGDAYTVGEHFLENDLDVTAFQIAPLEGCSLLCQLHAKKFSKKGGKILLVEELDRMAIPKDCLLIDGLLGIGYRGEVKGLMKELIDHVNSLPNPILSIDIPSGVCGNTGLVGSSAIFADLTAYMGVLKVGHFFNQGYEHVGELHRIDFGMSAKYVDAMEPVAFLLNPAVIPHNFPHHKRKTNKYSRGQAAVIAGSKGMPGSAMLATKAALCSGAGIVRLFHPQGMEAELSCLIPEVVRIALAEESYAPFLAEMARTQAILIGPGLGRENFASTILEAVCQNREIPLVIDGDALFFFAKSLSPTVLTPHRGELCRLLALSDKSDDLQLLTLTLQYAKEKNVVVVMKGAPTIVLTPTGKKIIIPYGNVGMASAGMGDVLAGIITALIAQGQEIFEAAVLGVAIHGLAGDRAKEEKSTFAMIASDLIDCLPFVFKN